MLWYITGISQPVGADSILQQLSTQERSILKAYCNVNESIQNNFKNNKLTKATTPTERKLLHEKKIGRLSSYMSLYVGYGFPSSSGVSNSSRYTQYIAGMEAMYNVNENWDIGIGAQYLHVTGHTYEDMEKIKVSRNCLGLNVPARWFPIGKIFYLEVRPGITWQRVRNYDWDESDEDQSKYELANIKFGCPLGAGFEIPVSRTIFFLVGGYYNPVNSNNPGSSAVPFSLMASVCVNIE